MSAWKARVRGLNHTEQSINTETTPIRNTQGSRGVSYSELNQRLNKLLMNCKHRIPAENIFSVLNRVKISNLWRNQTWVKYPSGAYALLLLNHCQKSCDILTSVSQVNETNKGMKNSKYPSNACKRVVSFPCHATLLPLSVA